MLRHCVLALLVAASVAPTAADAAGGNIFSTSFEGSWIAGYHVGYQRDMYPIADIKFADMTHLIVGRITPNANGTVNTTFDIDPTNGPQFAIAASAAAHAHNVKAILMVGGAGEYNGWVGAASAANRATFVANLLSTMDQFGYDGLDLDWEPINTSDEPNFRALAQALRTARPNILLTVPVGWINANFAGTPSAFYPTIVPYFDQINVMSYDMAGPWDGWQSWHSSALFGSSGNTPSSIDTTVDYYLRSGVPRRKLGVGIPFYGACWRSVTAPHQTGGVFIASDNTMSYRNIMANYYSAAVRHWDPVAMATYLGSSSMLGPSQCNFVSYDDEESIAAKGAYSRQHGLGGTIIWTIAQGYLSTRPVGQRDPLLDAIRAAF